MIKKAVSLLAVCLLLFGLGFSALAEQAPAANDGALYGDYEDDWFDNGYDGLENEPDGDEESAPRLPWYRRISVVPILFGAAVGAAAVAFLTRRSRPELPSAAPFELHPDTRMEEAYDRLADESHTTRNLK